MSRKIFIDGGALDGCSIKKFLRNRIEKDWHVFSFEPNPYLKEDLDKVASHFSNVTIHQKAISTKNENSDFYVMYTPASIKVRGDKKKNGSSSLLHEKIEWKQFKNDYLGHEKVTVECVDFSEWLSNNIQPEDYVVLKMDIEGSEYDVLEKLIEEGTFDLIDELYMEWHDYKVKIPRSRHDELLSNIQKYNLKKIDYNWNGST